MATVSTYHLPYYRASQIPRRIKLLSFNNILPSVLHDTTNSPVWRTRWHKKLELAGILSREDREGGATRRGLLFISNGYHPGSPPRDLFEGNTHRGILSYEDVVGGMACRRFPCQARSTFLQVMTFYFAKNHLSALLEKLSAWRNDLVGGERNVELSSFSGVRWQHKPQLWTVKWSEVMDNENIC